MLLENYEKVYKKKKSEEKSSDHGWPIDTKLMMASQPKTVTRKFQILRFPEQDAKLFYKVVFGRWFLMLVIMLFITTLYKFGVHWSNNRREIQIQQREDNKIKKGMELLV